MYGFGKFTLNLNYLDEEMKLFIAPTDTRLRPDQRLHEQFNFEEAEKEKARMEVKQRQVRKMREQEGIQYKPLWFIEEKEEGSDATHYIFNGEYFKKREEGDWSQSPDLF